MLKDRGIIERIKRSIVKVTIENGRANIAGRLYHGSHFYLVGFRKAHVKTTPYNVSLSMEFHGLPKISTNNGTIEVKSNGDIKPLSTTKTQFIERKNNISKGYSEPLKIHVETDTTSSLAVSDELKVSGKNIELEIDNDKCILNMLTYPFISIWIYCDKGFFELKQENSKVFIKVKKLL